MTANTKMTEDSAWSFIKDWEATPRMETMNQYYIAMGFLQGFQAGRAEMAEAKEVFEITHRVNENALTVVELESRLSHLSAVNEKMKVLIQGLSGSLRHCMHCSTCGEACSDCSDCTAENYLKLADEMGEGK